MTLQCEHELITNKHVGLNFRKAASCTHKYKHLEIQLIVHNDYISRMHGADPMQFSTVVQSSNIPYITKWWQGKFGKLSESGAICQSLPHHHFALYSISAHQLFNE